MPRFILTGTPGSGKTALLRLLETGGSIVVEEAATDVIALQQSLGREEPWEESAFLEWVVDLQRRREARTRVPDGEAAFFDRSPLCTLALGRYLGTTTPCLLAEEVDRVLRDRVYEPTVFFVRHQGSVQATAARRITFADSLVFERVHEDTYRQHGFRLIDIPAGPLVERARQVRQTVRHLGHDDRRAT